MTTYKPWTPPPGAVVKPPVHPKTTVNAIYSDGLVSQYDVAAEAINWSSVGDGPTVVAYAIVDEYKPAPREFWIVGECEAYDSEQEAIAGANSIFGEQPIIHVREVLPGREVVAWAVVYDSDGETTYWAFEDSAKDFALQYGGTAVKLTGLMP